MSRQIAQNFGALACIGILTVGTSSTAGPAEPAPRPVVNSIEDPYPPAARALNLPGHATLNCAANADGSVHNCTVANEDPPDWGFGQGALKVAPTINVGPGVPGRQVQLPISFQLENGEVSNPQIRTPGFFIPSDQIKWVLKPEARDFAATYPDDALQQQRQVRVVFACRVAAKGTLTSCVVLSKEPKDEDILKAVSYMTTRFRMAPRLRDGGPVENGVMKMALRWTVKN